MDRLGYVWNVLLIKSSDTQSARSEDVNVVFCHQFVALGNYRIMSSFSVTREWSVGEQSILLDDELPAAGSFESDHFVAEEAAHLSDSACDFLQFSQPIVVIILRSQYLSHYARRISARSARNFFSD